MEKGKQVTQTEITKIFKDMILKVNEATSSEISELSSGQILSFGFSKTPYVSTEDVATVAEILDVGSEQFFDNYNIPQIFDFSGKYLNKPVNYLQKLLNDVKILTEV